MTTRAKAKRKLQPGIASGEEVTTLTLDYAIAQIESLSAELATLKASLEFHTNGAGAEVARNILANGGISKDQATYALDITNSNLRGLAAAYLSAIKPAQLKEAPKVDRDDTDASGSQGRAFEAAMANVVPAPQPAGATERAEVTEAVAAIIAGAPAAKMDWLERNVPRCVQKANDVMALLSSRGVGVK